MSNAVPSSGTAVSSRNFSGTLNEQLQQVDGQIQSSDSTSPSIETTTDTISEDEDEFNPYLFIKHLPPYQLLTNTYCNLNKYLYKRPMQCPLPPKQKSDPPITLVLDLDETLVHCTVDVIPDADVCFPVFFGGIQYNVHVRLRPHLSGFLQRVSRHFEVIVFTASQKVYANELLNRIDPQGQYIRHRLYRESCLAVEGNYLKDLNVLTGCTRSLEQMALVDNSPHAFGYQIDNGIPIESWFDDRNDTELLKLEAFLMTLVGCDDVRPLIREKFQTFRLIQEA
jgi:CTD small phosphatase-like protein 2